MSATAFGIMLVGVCAINEGFGQLVFKMSVTAGARRYFWIAAGVGIFILDAVLYSIALRFLNVNIAFAIGALGMVSIAAMSKWLLKEHITTIRWAGIVLIVIGTGLIVSQA